MQLFTQKQQNQPLMSVEELLSDLNSMMEKVGKMHAISGTQGLEQANNILTQCFHEVASAMQPTATREAGEDTGVPNPSAPRI